MDREKFSQSMGEIDDRFISQALSYKPKKKIIPLYKNVVALAAVLAVIVVSVVAASFFRTDNIKVYLGDSPITGKEQAVYETQRGISLAGEIEKVSLLLKLKTDNGARVSVSDGFILQPDSLSGDDSKTVSAGADVSLLWTVDNADRNRVFTMEISSQKGKTVLTLKFSTQKNSWVISKD